MATRQANREQDLRLELLNSLLTTPHRELAKIRPVHQEMVTKDPRFYVRLSAWYADHGDVREREADPDWFDGSVLVARKAIKRLYALLHVKPSERAQQILFDENPPADSRLAALKILARAKTPVEQAEAIIEHRIPYRV